MGRERAYRGSMNSLTKVLVIGLAGCVGGGSQCLPPETVVAIARAEGSGNCGSDVLAGIALLSQTITLAKGASCGMDHFSITTTFTQQSGSGANCQGSDAMSFDDLGSDGGMGTDIMNITCSSGISCAETFDVTFTPQ